MYDLAYYRAKGMLQKNRQVLEKIVEQLLEFEILTGKVNNYYFELSRWVCSVRMFFLSVLSPLPSFPRRVFGLCG